MGLRHAGDRIWGLRCPLEGGAKNVHLRNRAGQDMGAALHLCCCPKGAVLPPCCLFAQQRYAVLGMQYGMVCSMVCSTPPLVCSTPPLYGMQYSPLAACSLNSGKFARQQYRAGQDMGEAPPLCCCPKGAVLPPCCCPKGCACGGARRGTPPAQGSGSRVEGSGCRVQGSGCRVQGSGCSTPPLLLPERLRLWHLLIERNNRSRAEREKQQVTSWERETTSYEPRSERERDKRLRAFRH